MSTCSSQASYRQLLDEVAQNCSHAIEISTVYIATSNSTCSGAVILSQLKHVHNCSAHHVLQNSRIWLARNASSGTQLETSIDTNSSCKPLRRGRKHVCPNIAYCDEIVIWANRQEWERCRILIAGRQSKKNSNPVDSSLVVIRGKKS